MTPEKPLADPVSREDETLLTWSIHPITTRPLRLVCLLAVLAAVLGLIYTMMGSLWWVAFGAVVLFLSLRQYFLPTTFRLTDQAVVSRFLWFEQRRQWDQFKSFFVDRNGVLLSPFPNPSRLENFRGFYLIGANRRPEIVEFIEKKIRGARTP